MLCCAQYYAKAISQFGCEQGCRHLAGDVVGASGAIGHDQAVHVSRVVWGVIQMHEGPHQCRLWQHKGGARRWVSRRQGDCSPDATTCTLGMAFCATSMQYGAAPPLHPSMCYIPPPRPSQQPRTLAASWWKQHPPYPSLSSDRPAPYPSYGHAGDSTYMYLHVCANVSTYIPYQKCYAAGHMAMMPSNRPA